MKWHKSHRGDLRALPLADRMTTPLESLRRELAARRWGQKDFRRELSAIDCEYSAAHVSRVLAGRCVMPDPMRDACEKLFGIPFNAWPDKQ
jgi:hypothetical protein